MKDIFPKYIQNPGIIGWTAVVLGFLFVGGSIWILAWAVLKTGGLL